MIFSPASEPISVRIDCDALAVLEWHARIDNVPVRSWLREVAEERAEQISREYDLPNGTPLASPALGTFEPESSPVQRRQR